MKIRRHSVTILLESISQATNAGFTLRAGCAPQAGCTGPVLGPGLIPRPQLTAFGTCTCQSQASRGPQVRLLTCRRAEPALCASCLAAHAHDSRLLLVAARRQAIAVVRSIQSLMDFIPSACAHCLCLCSQAWGTASACSGYSRCWRPWEACALKVSNTVRNEGATALLMQLQQLTCKPCVPCRGRSAV
jgi:hypothetical protein